jgi:SAM-dependent methyltransferase
VSEVERNVARSGYLAPGFAEHYDENRPAAPAAIVELALALSAECPPALVVDLGCGTGLSTRIWGPHAGEVVGVDPNPEMLRVASERTRAPNVRYVHAAAQATGLRGDAAAVVTASQSLQWMAPEPTFAEICRLLRPGGVFVAYAYESLLTPFFEPEEAWAQVRERVGRERDRRGLERELRRWSVSLERLSDAGCFEHVRELTLHSVEQGDAARLVGFALSEGSLSTLLEAGATETDVGLDRLREIAERTIGATPCPWFISYRAWVGVRAG